MEIVSNRLRHLRKSLNYSQMKMAKIAGITQSSLHRYETDNGSPPLEVLLWFADHFDVSMDYIFGRCDEPQGKLYEFKPKIEDDEQMREFVEMCFDPNSPMNTRLKDIMLEMMKGGKE